MKGNRRLADFQRLMRSWKQLAPYNAVHVLQVSGAANIERWEEALNRTLSQIETGKVRVETSGSDVDLTITDELNRSFNAEEAPVRAVVIPAERDHFLALVYDHWFADSPSIRAFLHRAFEYYCAGSARFPPLQRATRSRSRSAFGAIADGVRTYRRHRRAARIHLRDPFDFRTGFFSRHLTPRTIDAIRATARAYDAKVNDVFLASAAQALGEYTAAQRATSRRDQIAVATAVDLRESGADAAFGFDVTYFSVLLDDPEQQPIHRLVRAVAQQTRAMKTNEQIARFNGSLKCALFASSLTSNRKRQAELFRKGLPLVAGISNVNLSGTWVEKAAHSPDEPRLLDYLRVSPVGPLLPLVFTLTTIADRLSLCVSFRTTAFSSEAAVKLADAFVARLVALSESSL